MSLEMALAVIGALAAMVGVVVALFSSARAYGRLESKVDALAEVAQHAAQVPRIDERLKSVERQVRDSRAWRHGPVSRPEHREDDEDIT